MLQTDTQDAVSTAIGLTTIKFAEFWKANHERFDLVFCLGDRYEMFAAVVAGIPFQVPFAHIHGGERTTGAIDNIFRHLITLASTWHFVSTEAYAKRVAELTESEKNVYCVGSISLENIDEFSLLDVVTFKEKWGVDLSVKTVLVTFHPETAGDTDTRALVGELVAAIEKLNAYQFIITMPNADIAGSIIRKVFIDAFGSTGNVYIIENLGTQSYFTALKHVSFLLGNTSSGIIEAASFNKYVINLGERQRGRACGRNVLQIPVNRDRILEAVDYIERKGLWKGENIYNKGGATTQIISILKTL
jgi:GDP/UDP-N,N'-diacetylbacillosamine 2-epimerase (hydrolysing)